MKTKDLSQLLVLNVMVIPIVLRVTVQVRVVKPVTERVSIAVRVEKLVKIRVVMGPEDALHVVVQENIVGNAVEMEDANLAKGENAINAMVVVRWNVAIATVTENVGNALEME